MLAGSSNDGSKFGLEGSTANEETVDIGLRDQDSGIASVSRATILDTGLAGNFTGELVSEPLADESMGLLSDLRGSSLTSADSPDGLVSDNES